ncbi:MAG TPA: hypothetical protein VHY09_14455 [Candidatus Methylacidiphilales bacterium]|jgi:hypothetical protein|nr:hypothetical protein [Candidatus Methylacidiphilales bacterium]
MSKYCLAEIATLVIGWGSNLLFLVYSQGFFYSMRPEHLLNADFMRFAAILAFPYLLTFLCCWPSCRYVKAFLMLSLLLTIGSTVVYYGFFVAQRPPDGGWIFLAVPLAQTMIAVAFSLVVFLFSLVMRLRARLVPALQPAAEPAALV